MKIIALFLWISTAFNENFYGFPFSYLSLIVLLFSFQKKAEINNLFLFKFNINKSIAIFFLFLVLYYLASIFLGDYPANTLNYLFGILASILCVSLLNNIKQKEPNLITLSNTLIYFTYVGFCLSLISLLLFGGPRANTFSSSLNYNLLFLHNDPNLASFISIFLIYLFNSANKKFAAVFVSIISFLSGSRTFIIMLLVYYIIFTFLKVRSNLIKLTLPKKYIFIFLFCFLVFSQFSITTSRGNLQYMFSNTKLYVQGLINRDISILKTDLERYRLLNSNLSLLKERKGVPIPAGLKNYQSNLLPHAKAYNVRPAKAHNFYISYGAEYGYLFLYLLFIIILNLRFTILYRDKNLLASQLAILVGFFGNEFFISPFVFILLFSKPAEVGLNKRIT